MSRKMLAMALGAVFSVSLLGSAPGLCSQGKGVISKNRAMTKEDVVNMVTSEIGDDVIIRQMVATDSHFKLSISDIVEMKKAGVSENVIEFMIGTGIETTDDKPVARPRHYYYYGGVLDDAVLVYPYVPRPYWRIGYPFPRLSFDVHIGGHGRPESRPGRWDRPGRPWHHRR